MWLGDTQLGLTRKLHTQSFQSKSGRFFWCHDFFFLANSQGHSDWALRFRHPVPFRTLDQGQGRRKIWLKFGSLHLRSSIKSRWQPTGFLPPLFFFVGFSNCCIISASLNGMGGNHIGIIYGQVNLKWMRGCSAQLCQNDKPSYQKMRNW